MRAARCGIVELQPLLEQRRDLPGQADHGVERAARAGFPGRLEHLLHVFRDKWNLRRHADAHRNARIGQRAQGSQPPMRRGGAGLQLAREFAVERGDGDVDGGQLFGRHGRDQVEIVFDGARLGDHAEGMARFLQQRDHRSRETQFALDGLVAVGRRADRQVARSVVLAAEFGTKNRRDVALGDQLGFEVESRRKIRGSCASAAQSNRCSRARSRDRD